MCHRYHRPVTSFSPSPLGYPPPPHHHFLSLSTFMQVLLLLLILAVNFGGSCDGCGTKNFQDYFPIHSCIVK